MNRILNWEFSDERPEDDEIHQTHSEEVPNVYGHGHAPYLANVIRAILDDQPGLVEAHEGRKNVEILTALYESAATGGMPVTPGCAIRHSRLGRG